MLFSLPSTLFLSVRLPYESVVCVTALYVRETASSSIKSEKKKEKEKDTESYSFCIILYYIYLLFGGDFIMLEL
jgi:hypothetical protein